MAELINQDAESCYIRLSSSLAPMPSSFLLRNLTSMVGGSVSFLLKNASSRPSLMRSSQIVILILILRFPFFEQL